MPSPGRTDAFATAIGLEEHQRSCFGEHIGAMDDGRFQCLLCERVCNKWGSIRSHMKSHAKVRPCSQAQDMKYSCDTCPDAKFDLRKELDEHNRTKHLRCLTCGKDSKSMTMARQHALMHEVCPSRSQTRPFVCRKCPTRRMFYTQADLIAHEATCLSDRILILNPGDGASLFECDICQARQDSWQSARSHMRVHVSTHRPSGCVQGARQSHRRP